MNPSIAALRGHFVEKHQWRTWNPFSPSTWSTSVFSTFSTFAWEGPSLMSLRKLSITGPSPWTSPATCFMSVTSPTILGCWRSINQGKGTQWRTSTLPSEVLRTQPVTPYESAFFRVKYLDYSITILLLTSRLRNCYRKLTPIYRLALFRVLKRADGVTLYLTMYREGNLVGRQHKICQGVTGCFLTRFAIVLVVLFVDRSPHTVLCRERRGAEVARSRSSLSGSTREKGGDSDWLVSCLSAFSFLESSFILASSFSSSKTMQESFLNVLACTICHSSKV